MIRTLLVAFLGLILVASVATAAEPVTEKYAVEVFGNQHGAEGRFLMLGPNGGAFGAYGGASEGVLDTGDAIRFGAIARYNVITNGAAPVGNLFPQIIAQFLAVFGLPETTPVNTYAGIAIGGLYGHENEDLSWEIRPHVGVQASFLALELSRGLGDLTGEQDAGNGWLMSVGVTYQW